MGWIGRMVEVPAGRGGSEHVRDNRRYWDSRAEQYVAPARRNWAAAEPVWGIWGTPQSRLPVLPDEVAGLDVIELGCGTAYVSAWLARRGARCVGIDNSPRQLATARALQETHGLRFPLYLCDAEAVACADASFDLAISEYGAAIWCDPYRWIPEAARVLRPGGRLIFMRNATLLMLCLPDRGPAGDRLVRAQFGLSRLEWDDAEGRNVEFHLPHGELIRLLCGSGFTVEDLIEVRAPQEAVTRYDFVTGEWARRWPSEEVWFARRSA
jgi:SAM-dependent methyltransferase